MSWDPPPTLHEEHLEFADDAETIRRVADSVGMVPLPELRQRICEAYDILTRRSIPHAMAEDHSPLSQVTVPLPHATVADPVTREHLAIAQLVEELEALRWELAHPAISEAQELALRRVLYGLYALMRVHLVVKGPCMCDINDVGDVVDVR